MPAVPPRRDTLVSLSLAAAMVACASSQASPSAAVAASPTPADSGPSMMTPIEPAAVPSSGPTDWMWEVVGGARVVYARLRDASGSVACERWRLFPEDRLAEYVGTVRFEEQGQPD